MPSFRPAPCAIAVLIALGSVLMAHAQTPTASEALTLHISPTGNDAWSGIPPEPSVDGTDGPLASLHGARNAIRALREKDAATGAVTVLVRGGVYYLDQTFTLEPQDSGTPDAMLAYAAYPGESPVISGGRVISGWKQEAHLWTVDGLPDEWHFGTLWVNGERRTRARTPNEGYFHTAGSAPTIEDPNTGDSVVRNTVAFKYDDGDIARWENLDDALVVVLHSWESSFHHIASIEEEESVVVFTNASVWPFENWGPKQRYYVENTYEGLDQPGEWYLNRQENKLYYYPIEGEDMASAEVIAPVLERIVGLEGNPNTQAFVEHVTFKGLRFQHAAYTPGPDGYAETAAAVAVPAAIQARGARFCAIEDCEIARVDTYGIWFRVGSAGNRIVRNELHDLGAGGIRLGERQRSSDLLDVKHNVIDNNLIYRCGQVYPAGIGVWVGQSPFNRVSHNEIFDLANSAITIGFAWGDEQGFSYGNLVEYNRIHDIGKAQFDNLAGVYILGGSWGTVVRNNVIHDVRCYAYGGWGIHADEGSSYLTIENNVVYNTASSNFDQYYGSANRVANNIFAFADGSQVSLSNTKGAVPVVFEHNIVVTSSAQLHGANWDVATIWQDRNCYWDTAGAGLDFGGDAFAAWQTSGKDLHSLVADPLFENASTGDFRLKPESPALALGFRPIDTAAPGLYGPAEWTAKPGAIEPAAYEPSSVLMYAPAADGFEDTTSGATPDGPVRFGVNSRATILVTDETAASGSHSLKINDTEGPQEPWQPEMCYAPRFKDGTAAVNFDLRMTEGAVFQHDWRTDWAGRRVGPRIKFDEQGKLLVGNDEESLMEVPRGEWVHVEIQCVLGKDAPIPATFDLAVSVPGQETKRFEGLPCVYRMFRVIERCWFMSPAQTGAVYYLDNIRIERK